MEDPSFDMTHIVLVEGDSPSFEMTQPEPGAFERATIAAYEPDRVAIDVEAASAGALVLSDAYEPGWSANLDGHTLPVTYANRVMRAVAVPPGRHRVLMTYQPPGFAAGALLSAFGGLTLLGLAIVERRRKGPSVSRFNTLAPS